MPTLKEIVEQHYAIELALMDNGGELTPEIESMIDANVVSFEDKLDGYARFINHLKTQAGGIDLRVKELQARKKSLLNTVDSLRGRMLASMIETGVKSAKTSEFTYSASTKKSYELLEDQIPDDLTPDLVDSGMLTFIKKYDKTAIKKQNLGYDFVVETEKDSIAIRG